MRNQYSLIGNSLVVQWLSLVAFTAMGLSLICAWGTKMPQVVWHSQKKKRKENLLIGSSGVGELWVI